MAIVGDALHTLTAYLLNFPSEQHKSNHSFETVGLYMLKWYVAVMRVITFIGILKGLEHSVFFLAFSKVKTQKQMSNEWIKCSICLR